MSVCIGVNEVGICQAVLAEADLDVILLAGRYTLVDSRALETLLPECVRRDVAVVLGGLFNSGILATGTHPRDGSAPKFDYGPASADVVGRVAAIERICDRHHVSLRAAALQFPLGHPAVACVLAGARTAEEVVENVAAALPNTFWRALAAARLIPAAAPWPKPP